MTITVNSALPNFGTGEAERFKLRKQIDHGKCYISEDDLSQKGWSESLDPFKFWEPLLTLEWIKMSIPNFVYITG